VAERASSLETWLYDVWHGRGSAIVRGGLSAAAVAYRGALGVRSAAYRLGLLSTRGLPVPVISVGNVTMGGSGKTPLVEVVVLALVEMGARPAVISRGYGRRTRGVRIVADAGGLRLGARDGGDEPVLLAERLPGVPIVVGESRYEAGAVAVGTCGAGALVIDDGFQHRTLTKDLEIVVVAGSDPWGNGRLFPRGALREPLSALGRAGVVVVTNPPAAATTSEIAHVLRRNGSAAAVLSGSYQPVSLRRGDHVRAEAPEALAGTKVLLLAGLAAPATFAATVEGLGAEVVDLEEFPDHHWYTPEDLIPVAVRLRAAGAEAVLTTEKDWVRLREIPRGNLPVWVLSVRLDLGADSVGLTQALGETLRRATAGRRIA
jgi:tetraacyldisaccharide 4'-kinase